MKADLPPTEDDTRSLQKLIRAKLLNLPLPLPAWAEDLLLQECGASWDDLGNIAFMYHLLDHATLLKIETFIRRWNSGGITRDGSLVVDPRSLGVLDKPIESMERGLQSAPDAEPSDSEPTRLQRLFLLACVAPVTTANLAKERPTCATSTTPSPNRPSAYSDSTTEPFFAPVRKPRTKNGEPKPESQPPPPASEPKPTPRMKSKAPISQRQKDLLARWKSMDKPYGTAAKLKRLAEFKAQSTVNDFQKSAYAFSEDRLNLISDALDVLSSNGSTPPAKKKASKGHARAAKKKTRRQPAEDDSDVATITPANILDAVNAVEAAETSLDMAKRRLAEISLRYSRNLAA
jgi:hypothetical protein